MISEKLNAQGIRLRSYVTGNKKTLCPQCSHKRKKKKDPCLSVTINTEGAVYNCHHCGWSGAVFVNDRHYEPPKKAFKRPKEVENPQKPKSMYQWFKDRSISSKTIDLMQISITNRHIGDSSVACLTFPYFRNGELINRKFRTKDKRFLQDAGTESTLYNVDALKDQTTAIFVEGEMDVLACIEAGISNAVSLPGGAPEKPEETPGDHDKIFESLATCDEFIEPIEKFIIATDADGPGQVLAEELARRLGRDKCWLVKWPTINDCPRKDANEVLMEDGAEVLRECIENAEPYPIAGLFSAADLDKNVFEIYNSGKQRGLSTGWKELDNYLTIRTGDLTIITGFPSAGKSNWLDALMVNMAVNHNWRFTVCSFENMPNEQIANLSEKYTHQAFWDGAWSRMDAQTLQKSLDWINERFWFIRADQENPTIEWILELARAAVRRHGIKGLVIDPWNEIEHTRPANLSETEYVSQVLGMLRRFAKVNGVHIWFVVHPSKPYRGKDGKYPVPSLYDCAGSAHWAAKADFGVVIHRPDESTTVEVHIRKVRHKWLGQRGMVKLRYIKMTGEYSDDIEG